MRSCCLIVIKNLSLLCLFFGVTLRLSLFQEMPSEVQAATSKSIMGEERELLDKYAAKHFYARWNKYKAEASDVFI